MLDSKRGEQFALYRDTEMKNLTLVLLLSLVGCARFSTRQSDVSVSYEKGTNKVTRTITTEATSYSLWASKTALSKFKASQTDKTQSATVGSLSQESDVINTNVAELSANVVRAAIEAALKK